MPDWFLSATGAWLQDFVSYSSHAFSAIEGMQELSNKVTWGYILHNFASSRAMSWE